MYKKASLWKFALLILFTALFLAAVPQISLAQTSEICAECHSDFSYINTHHSLGIPSCFTCHEIGEGPSGEFLLLRPECFDCHVFAGGPGPGDTIHDFHTNLIPSQIQDCEACHVGGAPGGPLREPFGECKTCHTGFQGGPSGPLHQMHTNNFGAVNCSTCHGDSAPACSECHQIDRHDYRTGPGAPGHDFHTGFISNCETCHVSGAPGGPLREPFGECGSCHIGFQGGPSGDLHMRHTNELGASDCNTCHGDAAPACTQCHEQDRHDFRGGGGTGHSFHNTFISDCETCHVSGIAGGPLREPFIICADCHTGFQGGPASGQLHMQHTEEFGASNCTTCHGDDAPACNQCHEVVSTDLPGQMIHDFRNGPGTPGHNFHTTFITVCELCHVSGVAGGPLSEPYGECASCHTGFQNGPNGPLHQQHTNTFGANDCNTCHGADAPACSECHQQDRHDFRNGGGTGHTFHNGFINDCERCHVSGGVAGGPLREPFGECQACHTGFQGGPASGMLHQQHTGTFGASDCNICHGDNAPACSQCHEQDRHDFRGGGGTGHAFHNGIISDCQFCHVSAPPAGGPLREPFGECDSCHTGFQGGPSGELHQRHTSTLGASDCNICHGDNAPACTQCHAVDRHDFRGGGGTGHDFHNGFINNCERCHVSGAPDPGPLPPQVAGCVECHPGFVGGPRGSLHMQHTNNFGANNCAICHGANAPACGQCHGANVHHESSFSQSGDCAHCHTVPASAQDRPAQAACRQCHGTNQHNKGGPIQNYGACAACHDTTPFHAAPRDSRGNIRGVGYTRPAPGKGTFNLFWRQITNNGQDQEDTFLENIEPNGEDRDEGGFRFSRPTISFNLVRITHNGQSYNVPAFSGSGGPVDPPAATCSDYTSRRSCEDNGCDWSRRWNRCSSSGRSGWSDRSDSDD